MADRITTKMKVPELGKLEPWRIPATMPALLPNGDVEYPAWVRQCADEFQEKKLLLTHELRALHNWRLFHSRLESSRFRAAAQAQCPSCRAFRATATVRLPPTKTCTCHLEFERRVPEVDARFFPAELLAGKVGTKRARGAGGQTGRKMESRLGLDDAAEALFGDEAGL
ncbi:hypothetical protein T484DRAFT_1861161 [Baffinella frigidus]|nr:hypothetical protein T484DRAFT_1861161 [Cryptophyta sp. CCMP2293]